MDRKYWISVGDIAMCKKLDSFLLITYDFNKQNWMQAGPYRLCTIYYFDIFVSYDDTASQYV